MVTSRPRLPFGLLATAMAVATTHASCAVFDESMRRSRDDAGGSSSSSSGASSSGASSSSSSSSSGASPGVCFVEAPAGVGAEGCGGVGGEPITGAVEEEPNDTSPAQLSSRALVCGGVRDGDTDRFRFELSAGECFEVYVELAQAEMVLEGPGISETHAASAQLPFRASSAGELRISISPKSGGGTYKLLVR